ncbi:MAG: orotidine-5'-phosphate decarboxylase [Actinomycetota bacterium]|nr:orotidine-5'-phosphate decarboxylase [Actinomycetota bacterium]
MSAVGGDSARRTTNGSPAESFGDRLCQRVAERGSQVVLGLDPDPARLWPRAIELAGGAGDPPAPPQARAALAVAVHCSLAIEAAGPHCVAVKLQLACFERLGAPGWAVLRDVTDRAREHGLLVIADAKRGDIDVSAAAYAQAFFGETPTAFGPVEGVGVDALTVNPLLGADSIAPLAQGARERGGGLFVLVRTSNPGAADLQELALAGGESVSERLAAMVQALGAAGTADGPLDDIGAVVGANAPGRLARLRELMPRTPFLLPGVGAQGGQVEDLRAAFAPGPAGGLIAASRAIVYAYQREGGNPETSARREAARLQEQAWNLTT